MTSVKHCSRMRSGALLALALTGLVSVARGDSSAGGANAFGEKEDLQIVQAGEAAAAAMAARGKDPSEARQQLEQTFQRLEAKYPRSAAVRDEHGSFLYVRGEQQKGFECWEAAEKLDGNNANVCSHLGFWWMESGEIQRGTGYFEKAVALEPNDATSRNMLGTDLYLFRHQLTTAQRPETAIVDRALAELRKASELEPMDEEFAREYAETFYSIPVSKWPEALKAWQHFYSIARDKDYGAINLARVSLQMKDSAGARKYLDLVKGSAYTSLKERLLAKAAALAAG